MTGIEPLAPEHFGLAAAWLSDPAVNRWLTSEWRGRDVTPTVVAVAVRNRRNRLYLVRSGGTPCGIVALAEIEPQERCAMVWYLLGDAGAAGRGVTTAAVGALCRESFAALGMGSLYAWIVASNDRSRRVLEKNGFREAGRLRRAAVLDGAAEDRVYFDLVPEDLPAGER